METALVFFADQTLETAVADSARLIMTAQAQTQSLTAATFKNVVCARMYGLFDCQSGVYVNVQTYSSFGSITYTPPLDTNGNLQTSNFVISRAAAVTSWWCSCSINGHLCLADEPQPSNMSGNNRLLVATAAFRNEP